MAKTPFPSKRPKYYESTFEFDLAEMGKKDGEHRNGITFFGEGSEEITFSKWSRPEPPPLDPSKDTLCFQQIEVDHYTDKPLPGMPGCKVGPVPVMRMYGITEHGNSVCCHVHGFSPYFFISAHPSFTNVHCKPFKDALNNAIKKDMKNNNDNVHDFVLTVEIVERQTVYGYTGEKKSLFLKITVDLPELIFLCKKLLETQVVYPALHHKYIVYESNIDFDIRFMADTHMVGCSWIELKPGKWKLRGKDLHDLPLTTRCQLEVDVAWDQFIAHAPEGDWSKVARFRILSFDIECVGRKDIFPEPNHDPVIQISNMVILLGESTPFIRNIFTLDTCDSIDGCQVLSFEKESKMLEKWADFIRQLDPDIFTGYNINNFDFPYLINRAQHLYVRDFSYLGRIKDIKSVIKNQVLLSKQMGYRQKKSVNFEGRVSFDLYPVLVSNYKLQSYTLNAVSYHFLQEQKVDVHYSIISDLQNGNAQTRRHLAVYCLKDAYLPLRLLDKLMCIIIYMEMARVTGVSLSNLLTKGQQMKVISQLLRKTIERGYLIPDHHGQGNKQHVELAAYKPICQDYNNDPMDKAMNVRSLYPNIIIAHNICYTTLLSSTAQIEHNITKDDITRTPSNSSFVKCNRKKGILPEILECLLSAREVVKAKLNIEIDSLKRKILNGRLYALQESANFVYDFTSARQGKLPCLEVSSSVTAYGRITIEKTKQEVELHYRKEN